MVSTLVGELVFAMRVYRNCLILLLNRITYVEQVDLDMFDFYIILGIDWLHACFASIENKGGEVNFPKEPILEWKGKILFLEVISFLFQYLENDL